MAPQGLRVVAVASFVPAFPLLLAHGIVSHSPVPATGLVPLAFSAGFSLFILRRRARRQAPLSAPPGNERDNERDNERQPLLPSEEAGFVPPEDDADGVAINSQDNHDGQRTSNSRRLEDIHDRLPIIVFLADTALAAAILTVLVYTWLRSGGFSGQLAMLAAYGTIPMLASTLVHIYFAVRGLSHGLALPELTRWVAWQVVPADCPGCGHHLRPEATPDIPWFQSARNAAASTREWRFPALPPLAFPDVRAWVRSGVDDGDEDEDAEARPATGAESTTTSRRQWLRPPAWLGYGAVDETADEQRSEDGGETARLFVDHDGGTAPPYHDRDDFDNDRYDGGAAAARPAQALASNNSAEEVVVVGKKKQRKISSSSDAPDGEPGW